MAKKTFSGARVPYTDVINPNKLMPHISSALFKVFATASLIMAVFAPWDDFSNQFINSVRDLSSFATLFSFLILLIGRKNLGRWHFPTLMVFAVSFGVFSCLVIGPPVLAFTVPPAIAFGIISLCNFFRSRPMPFKTCLTIMLLTAPAVFGVMWYLFDNLFFPVVVGLEMFLFMLMPTVVFRFAADRKSSGKLTEDVNFITAALVIGHAGLSNLSVIIGVLLCFFA